MGVVGAQIVGVRFGGDRQRTDHGGGLRIGERQRGNGWIGAAAARAPSISDHPWHLRVVAAATVGGAPIGPSVVIGPLVASATQATATESKKVELTFVKGELVGVDGEKLDSEFLRQISPQYAPDLISNFVLNQNTDQIV